MILILRFGIFSVPGKDYESLNVTLTFEEEDLMKIVRVKLIDNEIVEGGRTFGAVITLPGRQLLSTQVEGSTANIEIKDDDSECVCTKEHVSH